MNAKTLLIVLGVSIGLALIVSVARRLMQATDAGSATLADFPRLLSSLANTGSDGAFWVVLVPNTARDDGALANLQYSIENGQIGMDWVLIAKRNLEDREAFRKFVTSAGATIEGRSRNDVSYLRVTNVPDMAKLGQEFLLGFYHIKPEDRLQLIITDFMWSPTVTRNASVTFGG